MNYELHLGKARRRSLCIIGRNIDMIVLPDTVEFQLDALITSPQESVIARPVIMQSI